MSRFEMNKGICNQEHLSKVQLCITLVVCCTLMQHESVIVMYIHKIILPEALMKLQCSRILYLLEGHLVAVESHQTFYATCSNETQKFYFQGFFLYNLLF